MSIVDTMMKEAMEQDTKTRIMNTAKRMIWVTFQGRYSKHPGGGGTRRSDPATGDEYDVIF